MKINLIQKTQNPLEVVWTACRTCYSDKESSELYEESYCGIKNINPAYDDGTWKELNQDFKEKQQKLVHKVLDSDHKSICRHVYFTFCLDGISRACANQLERHTAGFAYSQQSLRYVEIKDENILYEDICCLSQSDINNLVSKYFEIPYGKDEDLYDIFADNCFKNLQGYRELIKFGAKPEDARGILGLNFKTNVVCSCNLEAFIHLCNLRLCSRAQAEIQEMVQLMKKEILKHDEYKFLAKYLVPKCKTCTEKMKCEKR